MQNDEAVGLASALAGFALLSVGDSVIKGMAGLWSPIGIAALRFAIGACGLSVLLAAREGWAGFRPRRPWLQLARGACLAGATLTFFSSLFVMPLAEATALVFLAPILTALLSGPLLGETVRRQAYIASALAFLGVLVVLRPNIAEFGPVALLPVCAALFMALLMLANRASAGHGSALSMQAHMAIVAAPILAVATLAGDASGLPVLTLEWPPLEVWRGCAVVAVTASTAHWLIFHGTMRAGAALVSPMTYVQLLVAGGIGWWWFGERPDAVALLGAAMIIGAGLYLWRTSVSGQASRPSPA